MRLILASASPRRRELLAAAKIEIVDPWMWTRSRHEVRRRRPSKRVARLKADAGAARHPVRSCLVPIRPWCLAEVFGKPRDAADAAVISDGWLGALTTC
jgi:predicted house-cleaning NTP pyrophosphatase (Maf/HAM1 superfamily)